MIYFFFCLGMIVGWALTMVVYGCAMRRSEKQNALGNLPQGVLEMIYPRKKEVQ